MKRICLLLLIALLIIASACAQGDGGVITWDDLTAPDGELAEAVDEGEVIDSEIYEADGSVLITLTATGDFTIGGDFRKKNNIFENELKRHKGDIHFTMANVRDILLADDLTIVNFEGTLTESTYVPAKKKNNQFLFSAPPSYVKMLSENGVEAAALENNHIGDHGDDAYIETQQHLSDAGIVWSNSEHAGVSTVKGVEICMLSYLCIDRYESLWDKVPADIAAAKAKYPIVIVSFHWGNEKDYSPTKNQIKMGHLAVDAGADLVLGHHSHRINPIIEYKGKYICYSLGNFCFAGNEKPSDMTSYLFQTRFRIRDGEVSNEGFRIIPIRISSQTKTNDFIPTPLTKQSDIDKLLSVLKTNGKGLDGAVDNYPLEW